MKLGKSECIQGTCALHIHSFSVHTLLSGEHLLHLPLQYVCPCLGDPAYVSGLGIIILVKIEITHLTEILCLIILLCRGS